MEKWKRNLSQVENLLLINRKRSLNEINDNSDHKFLIHWINRQKLNYHTDIEKSKGLMKHFEIHELWSHLINDDHYSFYFKTTEELWKETFICLKKYIHENHKIPLVTDTDEVSVSLFKWVQRQRKHYHEDINCCLYIMKRTSMYNLWTEFISNDTFGYYFQNSRDKWKKTLIMVKEYIDEKNMLPSSCDNDKKIQALGKWISLQKKNYHDNILKCVHIMQYFEIHHLWRQFINDEKYSCWMKSSQTIWKEMFEKLKQYLLETNQTPSSNDENMDIKKLGIWFIRQKMYFHSDVEKCRFLMLDDEIRGIWNDFIIDSNYLHFFKTNQEIWKDTLMQLQVYIVKNGKRPMIQDPCTDIRRLAYWFDRQKSYYHIDIQKCRYIMKKEEIYLLWKSFLEFDSYYRKC